MRFITIASLAILAAASTADAQTKAQTFSRVGPPVVFEITARSYGADNVMAASAGNSAATGKLESYVTGSASLCGVSSSSSVPTTTPAVGWHVVGEIISATDASMTVRVDWQRIWEKGGRLNDGPKGSSTHTLRTGERVELDRVQSTGASSCNATDLRLEAAVVTKPAYRLDTRTFALDRLSTAHGRISGTTGTRGTTGTMSTTGAGGRGAGDLRQSFKTRSPLAAMLTSYTAELWLVHRKPDGTETTVPLAVQFSGSGGDYSFPAIQVATAKGPITIDISGKLLTFVGEPPDPNSAARINRVIAFRPREGDPNTAARMLVTINRRARASGPPLLDIAGGSTIAMEVPAPADVLSFELPALQKAAEDLLKGHQFSLRVKITPAGK